MIIWSWCGQVSTATPAEIDLYLNLMSGLEADYPNVTFVYMTGHLDGTGLTGNLHQRNEQIRAYCRAHNKVLYDFADIETYDPDGTYFGDKLPNDACGYDSDGNGTQDRNWAQDWQNSHVLGTDWYDCASAHSEPLNANLKAYAAWWLWARLAGWQGASGDAAVPDVLSVYPNPARDTVRFQLEGVEAGRVRVLLYNAAGEAALKLEEPFAPPSTVLSADTSHLAPGIYLYRVFFEGLRAGGGKVCIRR